MRSRIWIAAALLAVSAGAAAQQRIDRPGTIAHRSAGAHFPERIGEFQRANVVQYDSDGADLSASYNLTRGEDRVLVTIYVYPAARLGPVTGSGAQANETRASFCRREIDGVGQVIESQPVYRGARRIAEGAAPAVAGIDRALGLSSTYGFTAEFDGREQEVRSVTYLYCYVASGWLVKYRATSNAGFDAEAEVETLIRTGPWPGRNAPPALDETVQRTERGRTAAAA